MAGLNGRMIFEQQRRPATVKVNAYWARRHDIPAEVTPCHVLGIFQDSSEDGAYPVAVCELNDGRVLSAAPEEVQFVDTKEGEIVE